MNQPPSSDCTTTLFSTEELTLPTTRLLLLQRTLAVFGCAYSVAATDTDDIVLSSKEGPQLRTLLLSADGETMLWVTSPGADAFRTGDDLPCLSWTVEQFDERVVAQRWAGGAYGTWLN